MGGEYVRDCGSVAPLGKVGRIEAAIEEQEFTIPNVLAKECIRRIGMRWQGVLGSVQRVNGSRGHRLCGF